MKIGFLFQSFDKTGSKSMVREKGITFLTFRLSESTTTVAIWFEIVVSSFEFSGLRKFLRMFLGFLCPSVPPGKSSVIEMMLTFPGFGRHRTDPAPPH